MHATIKAVGYATIGAAALWSAAFWISFPDKIRAVSADSLPGAHYVAPAHWHAIDRDGNCFDKYTPASLIEISNANGIRSEPRETRDASGTLVRVDVVQREALGSSTVTFYRSKAACESAIAASKYIPSDYR